MFTKDKKEMKKQGKIYIYGKHALTEALTHAPQSIRKVFLDPKIKDSGLKKLIEQTNTPYAPLKANGASRVPSDATHQGVIATLNPENLLVPLADFLSTLDMERAPAIVLLDEVQDPHNVGAIIRSAAAFGVAGVLIPKRHQAGITGAVVKTSAGMTFRVPLVSIGNVNQTLHLLKEFGFWTYSLVATGKHPITNEHFNSPACFVLGNESTGVRQKTRGLCDIPLAIQINKRCESLNVAAAAAVVFYAWSTDHPEALTEMNRPVTLPTQKNIAT